MPKIEGRATNKPQPVNLSQYLVDHWLMPSRDGGLCAAGCGRTIVGCSRCSTIVPESTVLHTEPKNRCDLCRQGVKEHLAGLVATYLSPACAHCTLVVEVGRPCCLADLPLDRFVTSIYGEDACAQEPGHAGKHRNQRGDEW